MLEKIKQCWAYLQDLMDVRGDVIMMVMSAIFIARVALSAFGKPGLNASEAAMYASAIASFAYSNKGPKGS
jgi:hypothetical protein